MKCELTDGLTMLATSEDRMSPFKHYAAKFGTKQTTQK